MTEVVHRMKRSALERLIQWLKDTDDDHWRMETTLEIRDDTETWEMLDHGEDLDRVPMCHTAGCFAGHCVLLQAIDAQRMVPLGIVQQGAIIGQAVQFLGINASDDYLTLKEFLFTPNLTYSDVTRQVAIDVLEHIRDYGVLHWGKFVKSSYALHGTGITSPLPVVLY